MSFVLVYDIPFGLDTEKRRVNRMLHRTGARCVQQSFWRCDDLKNLVSIGMCVRRLGGKAEILEERFLF